MKKIIVLALIVLCSTTLFAQKYSEIKGAVTNPSGETIKLYTIEDGMNVEYASTKFTEKGEFGFKIIVDRERFYMIGDSRMQVPVYLKPGDDVTINVEGIKGTLVGKNTKENIELYKWEEWVFPIHDCGNGVTYNGLVTTYEKFFPFFEEYLPRLQEGAAKIKCPSNPTFETLLKAKMKHDLDYYMIYFVRSGRYVHPTPEQYPAYLKNITPTTVISENILEIPNGNAMISKYVEYMFFRQKDYYTKVINYLKNDRLIGEYLLSTTHHIKDYADYEKFIAKYNQYFTTASQKLRVEKLCIKHAVCTEGKPAVNFTFSDINDKMVSLNDFKGKVILIDVWATWCGPCMSEVPALNKLEEELKDYSDMVFIGVSVDKKKDKEKWLKTVKEKEMKGYQLFSENSKLMSDVYKATSIPRFIVIDKSGIVHSMRAPRPSSPELKKYY